MKRLIDQHSIKLLPVLLLFVLHLVACQQNRSSHQTTSIDTTAGTAQLSIWNGHIPDSALVTGVEKVERDTSHLVAGKPYTWVTNVSNPTITIFSPKNKNTGAAVMVFPGGGYLGLATDIEGSEICEWFASIGVTGILLKYRVPGSGPHHDDSCECRKDPVKPLALQDAQRAMGLVRFRAKEWGINPQKIGVIGFSAGGHLVADISTNYKKRSYQVLDSADKESCRPDFAMAIYPGHMLENATKDYQLNPTIPVDSNTPPTFLLQAGNDPVDTIQNSLVYYIALKKAGVQAEYHIYSAGGHAFGLRKTNLPISDWPKLGEQWLKTIKMIAE